MQRTNKELLDDIRMLSTGIKNRDIIIKALRDEITALEIKISET